MHPYYSELIQTSHLPGASRVRYSRWLNLLRRLCIDASTDFTSDYATLFSRLIAVCQARQIDHRYADRFRRNARRILKNEYKPTPQDEQADLADLCYFVMQLTSEPVPAELPQHARPVRIKATRAEAKTRCLRGVVSEVTGLYTFRFLPDDEDYTFNVEFWEDSETPEGERINTRSFAKGDNVMLLDAEAKQGAADTLTVYMAVLEPDYLIDISSLSAAVQPYGESPLNYLINQLAPRVINRYNLLGDMANQFMDDCINGGPHADERRSLQKGFRQHVLDYACLNDDEIPSDFFSQASEQFKHISETVNHRFEGPDVGISPDNVLLEPAFICPTLGLRGRLDVMTTDHRRVLELKSGKCNEWLDRPQESHLLQMSLYRELLRRNFNIEWYDLQSFLFYSRYPLFYNERTPAAAIRAVLALRNDIICMKRIIRQGGFIRLLPRLTADRLNTNQLTNRFFEVYLRPQIEAVTRPLQAMAESDPLLTSYVSHFLTFIEREQFMSKTSDNRPDSIRGFASAWTSDRHTRLLAGNLLTELTINDLTLDDEGAVEAVTLNMPDYGDELIPNFNKGEMVQLYEANEAGADMTNRQLIRGTVSEITATSITLSLSYKQRNRKLFEQTKRYAIEHDSIDGPSNQQVRNLFALVIAPEKRRELIMGRRLPEADTSRRLVGSYPEAVNDIVLQAKQARDLYLLVGPPGTGKTNLALRSMVEEFIRTRATKGDNYGSLMLTAYTNRAVDEICSMLDKLSHEVPLDYLRIGLRDTCAPAHQSHLLSERAANCTNRKEARQLIDRVPIIVGTVLTLTNNQILFRRKHFVAAIIDEASQLLEPQALGLLCARDNSGSDCAIDKFILIGDHKQLPAVVMLNEKQTTVHDQRLHEMGLSNLRNSLFERLHAWMQRANLPQFVGLLSRQGRMHPDICRFVNNCFYEKQLEAVPMEHQQKGEPWPDATPTNRWQQFVASTRMGFVNVLPASHGENVRANAAEATIVGELIEAICALHEQTQRDFVPEDSIGVIVPFRGQIAAVRKELRRRGYAWADRVTIDTVECYQGSQRDYILFSTTISELYQLDLLSSVQCVAGVDVDRKLNVAITRARRQLFIIGNRSLLEHSTIYRQLIRYCEVYDA